MSDQLHLIDAPEWGPQATDLLAGSRSVQWRFELLDRNLRVIDEADHKVMGFQAEWNLHATIRGGGTCTWRDSRPVDWLAHRLRAHYQVSSRGRSLEWCVGTFLVESPGRTLTDANTQLEDLDLFDMTHRLAQQTSTAAAWVGKRGTNIIDRIRYLLDRAGIAHAIEDSDATFTSDMVWEPGTTYLRMVNDMLAAAGFFACWADSLGVIRSTPHRPPAARGIAYAFQDDGHGLGFLPAVALNRDTYDIPNSVVAIAATDDPDTMPLVATADDMDSPVGVRARGWRKTHVEPDVPASSLTVLQARAAAILEQKQRRSSTLEVQHLPVPMAVNDIITISWPRHDIQTRAVVEKHSIGMGAGFVSTTTVREVTT